MTNPNPGRTSPLAQPETGAVTKAGSMPRRRPFGVTLLLWLVLCLSAWGLLRLAGALRWWDVLYENGARFSPLYLSVTGAGWAVAGIVLLWSIFSIKRWANMAIPLSISVWLAGYWIERIFFQGPRSNLVFTIAATVLVLTVTWISAFHRKTKNYLTKSEEHEQPEEYSTSS
jgi:hypothetical protein